MLVTLSLKTAEQIMIKECEEIVQTLEEYVMIMICGEESF